MYRAELTVVIYEYSFLTVNLIQIIAQQYSRHLLAQDIHQFNEHQVENPIMSSQFLGSLAGGRLDQYVNAVGQTYYEDVVTRAQSYVIPSGFEDAPGVCRSLLADLSVGFQVLILIVMPNRIHGPWTRRRLGHNGMRCTCIESLSRT
jgi:hypothetical protein